MNTNYYQDKQFEYTEIGVLLEDVKYKTKKGKFFIPILLPELNRDEPYTVDATRSSTSNIVNYNKRHGIGSSKESNFIELKIPEFIGYFLADESGTIKKDTEFLICFVGGELSSPRIIGVNES